MEDVRRLPRTKPSHQKGRIPVAANRLINAYVRGEFVFLDIGSEGGIPSSAHGAQDREKTAFITPSGLYQFLVMPFGLCNAPATFQRLVDSIFEKYIGHGIGVYIDDIVIYANTEEAHDDLLDLVLRMLMDNGLFLNMSKSMFGYRRVKYLGMIVDGRRHTPDPAKVLLGLEVATPKRRCRVAALLRDSRIFPTVYSRVCKPR